MKNIFLALLAVVAMVACNKLDSEMNYNFNFESGIIASESVESLTYEQYCENVVGSAWSIDFDSAHLILEDGSLEKKNFFHLLNGWIYTHYYFDKDSLISYFQDSPTPGYSITPIKYDNGAIVNDEYAVPLFTILDVKGSKMTCIQSVGWTPNIGYRFILCKYTRLSDSEYAKVKDEHTEKK